MRLRTAFVALALLALPACGKEAKPQAAPSPEITRSEGARIAQAAQLRSADMPGYRKEPPEESTDDDGGTCLRDGGPFVAEAETTFSRGRLFVGSTTEVAERRELVERDLDYIVSGDFLPCWEAFVTSMVAEDRFSLTGWSSRKLRVKVPKSDGAFGYVFRFTLRGGKGSVPGRMLFLGAAAGLAEMQVMALAFGTELPSTAAATGWLTKVTRRARAAGA
ncbi:MAG TPA: hypothetical protein VNQ77_09395 [Frankiaceae bacterium]|nr:hypothetical protein [Frankiaceae bacterium]